MRQKLNLKRIPHDQPDFPGMDAQIDRLKRLVFNPHLWEGEQPALWLGEILAFQAEDGSFALVDAGGTAPSRAGSGGEQGAAARPGLLLRAGPSGARV